VEPENAEAFSFLIIRDKDNLLEQLLQLDLTKMKLHQ
jgi:hypothetical protein